MLTRRTLTKRRGLLFSVLNSTADRRRGEGGGRGGGGWRVGAVSCSSSLSGRRSADTNGRAREQDQASRRVEGHCGVLLRLSHFFTRRSASSKLPTRSRRSSSASSARKPPESMGYINHHIPFIDQFDHLSPCFIMSRTVERVLLIQLSFHTRLGV